MRKKLDAPLYVRGLFERPGEPDRPLIAEATISPGDDELFLDSPEFQGIENLEGGLVPCPLCGGSGEVTPQVAKEFEETEEEDEE